MNRVRIDREDGWIDAGMDDLNQMDGAGGRREDRTQA